jgi:hypothetical protein
MKRMKPLAPSRALNIALKAVGVGGARGARRKAFLDATGHSLERGDDLIEGAIAFMNAVFDRGLPTHVSSLHIKARCANCTPNRPRQHRATSGLVRS